VKGNPRAPKRYKVDQFRTFRLALYTLAKAITLLPTTFEV
jgi:hypothetical protein